MQITGKNSGHSTGEETESVCCGGHESWIRNVKKRRFKGETRSRSAKQPMSESDACAFELVADSAFHDNNGGGGGVGGMMKALAVI